MNNNNPGDWYALLMGLCKSARETATESTRSGAICTSFEWNCTLCYFVTIQRMQLRCRRSPNSVAIYVKELTTFKYNFNHIVTINHLNDRRIWDAIKHSLFLIVAQLVVVAFLRSNFWWCDTVITFNKQLLEKPLHWCYFILKTAALHVDC